MGEFKTIFRGKISKKRLIYYYVPFMIGFYLICLMIARLLYPYIPLNPYVWTSSMISRLGWPEENPIGFIFFSIGFIVQGIMYFAITLYFYKKYSEINEFAAKLIRFLFIGYSTATLLIGAIPNYAQPPIFGIIHLINAIIIFFGFFIISLISALTMLRERLINKDNSNFSSKSLVIYISILIYYVICMLSIIIFFQTGLFGRNIIQSSMPFYLSSPFYEWQAYMTIFCLLIVQCLLLPEET